MADGDTVAEKIADIAASKAAIAQAITAKGVAVPDGSKLADLAPLVGQISGGGGAEDTCAIDRDTATELVIPEGVTQIGNYAFYNLNAYKLDIPEGVTRIGDHAFDTSDSVMSRVTLPSTLKTIGWGAFSGRDWRGDIDIPEGVTAIDGYAFNNSGSSFAYVIRLPGTLQSIGRNAFAGFGSAPNTYVPCFANGTKEAFKALFAAGQPYSLNVGLAVFCTDGTFLFNGSDSFEDDDDRVYGEATSEKDGNAITFDIQGVGFTWDDTKDDEGFFWVAHLEETGTKVQTVETIDPGRHFVVSVADMGTSGGPPGQLTFARRTAEGVLETAWESGYIFH